MNFSFLLSGFENVETSQKMKKRGKYALFDRKKTTTKIGKILNSVNFSLLVKCKYIFIETSSYCRARQLRRSGGYSFAYLVLDENVLHEYSQ